MTDGPLSPGDLLGGKYLLVHPLGAGGMGQVWKAQNAATGAEVAVKVLLPEHAASADALARFRDEAHAAAQLGHRGVVKIFDLVELDPGQGALLLVMELLRGQTLARRMQDHGALPLREVLAIVLPLLSALEHVHGMGVVHRDLTPENVFLALEPDGQTSPKLVDFGISKLRHGAECASPEGEIIGTPCYMSPEQVRGEDVDARSDVFGAGILLYECLSGTNPFRIGNELQSMMTAVLAYHPAPLAFLEPTVWAVLARALAKSPDERYGSARELADALRAAAPDDVASVGSASGRRRGSLPPTLRSLHLLRRRAPLAGRWAAALAAVLAFGAEPMSREPSMHESRPATVVYAAKHEVVPAPDHPRAALPAPRARTPRPHGAPRLQAPSARPQLLLASAAGARGAALPPLLKDPGF